MYINVGIHTYCSIEQNTKSLWRGFRYAQERVICMHSYKSSNKIGAAQVSVILWIVRTCLLHDVRGCMHCCKQIFSYTLNECELARYIVY